MIRKLKNLPLAEQNHLIELRLKEEVLKKRKLEMRESDKMYMDPNTGKWRNKIKPNYSNVGIGEDVKEMSTRKLLDELNWVRPRHYYDWVNGELDDDKSETNENYELQLKAELSKREHIPTKLQAKELRRKLAKKKK